VLGKAYSPFVYGSDIGETGEWVNDSHDSEPTSAGSLYEPSSQTNEDGEKSGFLMRRSAIALKPRLFLSDTRKGMVIRLLTLWVELNGDRQRLSNSSRMDSGLAARGSLEAVLMLYVA
jgi:hypothetical protein